MSGAETKIDKWHAAKNKTQRHYDVFISYMWGEHDSAFVDQLYGELNLRTMSGSQSAVKIFLDRMSLLPGRPFEEDSAEALTHTLVAVPVLSANMLRRFVNADVTQFMIPLSELILILEAAQADKIKFVHPVLFGAITTGTKGVQVANFYEVEYFHKLPSIVPAASIERAKELLIQNGIQPSDKMPSYTVQSIVQGVLEYGGTDTWHLPYEEVPKTVADKVVDSLFACDRSLIISADQGYDGAAADDDRTWDYDVYISYRWNMYDSKFADQLYEVLTGSTINSEGRTVRVFLDKLSVTPGRPFLQESTSALTHTLIAVPVLSIDALVRLLEHKAETIDNLLMEWILCLESFRAGAVKFVCPVMFGLRTPSVTDGEEVQVENFFRDGTFAKLPHTVPQATLDRARAVLIENKIRPSVGMDAYTVQSIVSALLKFVGIQASDIASNVAGTVKEKILLCLSSCQPARLAVGNTSADAPAPTSKVDSVGEDALAAALKEGSKAWWRSKFSLLGQGRAGKTALANAIAGKGFEETASTVGINQLTCDVKHVRAGAEGDGEQVWSECDKHSREYEAAVAAMVAQQRRAARGRAPGAPRPKSATKAKGGDIRAFMQSMAKPAAPLAVQDIGTFATDAAVAMPTEQETEPRTKEGEISEIGGAFAPSVHAAAAAAPAVSITETFQPSATASEAAPSVPAANTAGVVTAHAPAPVPSKLDEEMVMKLLGTMQDSPSGLLISLFDFGGQAVFDVIHHLFLTRNGVYALVFNMQWFLTDGPDKDTALTFMRKWLSSIAAHTLRARRTAPIVIVGTHLDVESVQSSAVHERISTILYDELHDSLAWPSVIKNDQGKDRNGRAEQVFFPVDSRAGRNGASLKHLMSVVYGAMDKAEYTHKEVPLTWFKAIDQMSDTKKDCLALSEVVSILSGCGVSEAEVPLLLSFLHDMGHLMWLDEPGLRDVVILDPVSYLVTPATIIICKLAPDSVDTIYHHMKVHDDCQADFPWEFEELVSRGILYTTVLPTMWKEYEQHTATLLLLMVKFGLLVPLRTNTTGASLQYLVPTLLSPAPLADPDLVHWTDKTCSEIYFVFTLVEQLQDRATLTVTDLAKSGFLPGGMFERIVGKALSWSQDTAKAAVITVDSVVLHKDLAILSFGQQRFRLVHCADIHCVRVDVEGSNPVGIQQKLIDFIRLIVQECMGSLFCFPAVLLETATSDRPSETVRKGLASSEMLIPLQKLRDAVDTKKPIQRTAKTILTHEVARAKYGQWLQLHELRERYDVFISYRWGEHDSKFTEQLFDMFTNYSVGAQSRAVEVFLDKRRLQEGRLFKSDFAAGLTHSLIALPMMSVDALQRMVEHVDTAVDNVLLEWIMILEAHKAGRVLNVFPLLFGERTKADIAGSHSVGDFFKHPYLGQLPKIHPTATAAQAVTLLKANGIQPSADLSSYTVHSVVDTLLQFFLWKAWDYPTSALVETFAQQVVSMLGDCGEAVLASVTTSELAAVGSAVTAVPAAVTVTNPTPTPNGATATASSGSTNRQLKELSVAEVCALMEKVGFKKVVPAFKENEVDGKQLALCEEFADLMSQDFGVSSKPVAKALMEMIEGWRIVGVEL